MKRSAAPTAAEPRQLFRFVEVRSGDMPATETGERQLRLAFSSEHPVLRMGDGLDDFNEEGEEYYEVLDHDRANADITLLNNAGAFLDEHDAKRHLGVVQTASIDGDRMGRAEIRFADDQLARDRYDAMVKGIRPHVSFGYSQTKLLSETKHTDGRPIRRFAWQAYEISSVAVPADPLVGVGRSKDTRKEEPEKTRTMMNDECVMQCSRAISVSAECLVKLEDCGEHGPAAKSVRTVITDCAIAQSHLRFWSESSAAQCVSACDLAAESCEAAEEKLKGCEDCEDCGETAESCANVLEDCADACRANAGTVDKRTKDKAMKRSILRDPNPTPGGGGGNPSPTPSPAPAPAPTVNVEEVRAREREAERKRTKELRAVVDNAATDFPHAATKFRAMEAEAVEKGETVEGFKARMFTELPGVKKVNERQSADYGIEIDDLEGYSLVRGIQNCIRNGSNVPKDGFEKEIHDHIVKRSNLPYSGFAVPPNLQVRRRMTRSERHASRMTRDLNVTNFGQGGAFVQTTVFTPIIEILRNRMVCDRLGVQSLAGLEGNAAIPRQTGAAAAYSLAESATLTKSTQTLDQILLTPHRVGAWNDYTKQLLLQSSVDVENFIRDDLMKVVAIKWDFLILQGQGAGAEPQGILNTPGIGSILFGAAATWANIVLFETTIAAANADVEDMAYVTTPAAKGRLKSIAKTGVGVTSVVPIFLWDNRNWADGSNDGEMNGYRAAATNQIMNNLLFFGNFRDAIHALYGGYDVVVNPYSRDTDATIRITVNTFGDVAVRHAASFCVSADSAAQ